MLVHDLNRHDMTLICGTIALERLNRIRLVDEHLAQINEYLWPDIPLTGYPDMMTNNCDIELD